MSANKNKTLCNVKNFTETIPLKGADILSHPKYICSSCTIITESLRKGCDVVQMPNGDIITREQKVVTTKYSWDSKKSKIIKVSNEIESAPKI